MKIAIVVALVAIVGVVLAPSDSASEYPSEQVEQEEQAESNRPTQEYPAQTHLRIQ